MSTTKKYIVNESTEKIWNCLNSWLKNEYAVAALMGNMDLSWVEIGKLDKPMEEFVHGKGRVGIMRWCDWVSKQELWNLIAATGGSRSDLDIQLDLIYDQLHRPSNEVVLTDLIRCKDIIEGVNIVLAEYMRAQNRNNAVKRSRCEQAKFYFDQYAPDLARYAAEREPKSEMDIPCRKVEIKYARITKTNAVVRKAAGILSRKAGHAYRGEEYQLIIESKNGKWAAIYFKDGAIRWVSKKDCEIFTKEESVDDVRFASGE